jgi:hypothetical protein
LSPCHSIREAAARAWIFTFVSGHGETVVECKHEERINQWLAAHRGTLLNVTQSESERPG